MSGTSTDDAAPRQELGTLLRQGRELRGFSVRGAAAHVDISGTYLSQLEAGVVKDPSPRILFKLSELYSVPYADLMRAAGYVVPGPTRASGQADGSHPLDVALRTTGPLTDDERQALSEYLAWYRSRRGRPPESR
jgi:HTH-type transcriptional regulator, competence development regulator